MTQTTISPRIVALDAPTEESFDRITAIALRLLDVPAAMITLASDGHAYHRTRAVVASPLDGHEAAAALRLAREGKKFF